MTDRASETAASAADIKLRGGSRSVGTDRMSEAVVSAAAAPPAAEPERLDVRLAHTGRARSRTHAQRLVRAGLVTVDGVPERRPGRRVPVSAQVAVQGDTHHVGRAAGKLDDALDSFAVDVAGRVALDAGASTGGFTQVLLERGAAQVFAVDVGHDQLAPRLATDPAVVDVEGVNLRWLELDQLRRPGLAHAPEEIDLVVGDLSFISLALVLPRLQQVLAPHDLVLLVKPQFEVGRGSLARGGIVVDPVLRLRAIETVAACAEGAGLHVAGLMRTGVVGRTGNQEYPIWLVPDAARGIDWRPLARALTTDARPAAHATAARRGEGVDGR